MKSHLHFYVFIVAPGHFRYGLKPPKDAEVCGRFSTKLSARDHARKLKRDFLSPAFTLDGRPHTPRERAVLGVWHPELLEAAIRTARQHPDGPHPLAKAANASSSNIAEGAIIQ